MALISYWVLGRGVPSLVFAFRAAGAAFRTAGAASFRTAGAGAAIRIVVALASRFSGA